MHHSLSRFPHIEFSREAVSKRAKETKAIIGELVLVAKHPDGEHRLYRNEKTDEYWQYASAWNWGAKAYCFIVPEIEVEDWKAQRYVDPDEMIVFVGSLQQFLAVPANRRIPELLKHVRMLQSIRTMPSDPEGRWFGPYLKENVIPDFDRISASNAHEA
ncbi:hypothetical protein [Brevifollis gellanilyticus]|uniref:Uncharacterized protein n=1 Tax=Brevifollis gellanilyticus TaxID=748831 RepID=A0A512MC18_9BACT|nr:hypothetical protein [Brevifollis gellanilyticus]GEP44289.1 hypothetical protein BGE01nite_35800 [Brevifollis gellanilyticus]